MTPNEFRTAAKKCRDIATKIPVNVWDQEYHDLILLAQQLEKAAKEQRHVDSAAIMSIAEGGLK